MAYDRLYGGEVEVSEWRVRLPGMSVMAVSDGSFIASVCGLGYTGYGDSIDEAVAQALDRAKNVMAALDEGGMLTQVLDNTKVEYRTASEVSDGC